MQRAIALASQAAEFGEIPVGAILVSPDGKIIGEGKNVVEDLADPTGHAEIVAIRQAGRNCRNHRLEGCVLVCTLEPCPMPVLPAWFLALQIRGRGLLSPGQNISTGRHPCAQSGILGGYARPSAPRCSMIFFI